MSLAIKTSLPSIDKAFIPPQVDREKRNTRQNFFSTAAKTSLAFSQQQEARAQLPQERPASQAVVSQVRRSFPIDLDSIKDAFPEEPQPRRQITFHPSNHRYPSSSEVRSGVLDAPRREAVRITPRSATQAVAERSLAASSTSTPSIMQRKWANPRSDNSDF